MTQLFFIILCFIFLILLSRYSIIEKQVRIDLDLTIPQDKKDLNPYPEMRDILIQKLMIKEYQRDKKDYLLFKKCDVEIGYNSNGHFYHLASTCFNQEGCLEDIKLSQIPRRTDYLYLLVTLGNKELGYITNSENYPYTYKVRIPIKAKTIKIKQVFLTSFSLHYNKKVALAQRAALRTLNYYVEVVTDQKKCVKAAQKVLGDKRELSFPPINIVFEKGFEKNKGNGFYRKGYKQAQKPNIVIRDKDNFTNNYLKGNIVHEWAHFMMYQAIGHHKMATGSYLSHDSYNSDFGVSYKEGWAQFQTNRYLYRYKLSPKKIMWVQTEKTEDGLSLLGLSTNNTVRGVLLDLYGAKNDPTLFEITSPFLSGLINLKKQDQLAEGLLYLAMMDSQASNLAELLLFIKTRYVKTLEQQNQFAKLLAINGLNEDGSFNNKKPDH